MGCTKIDRPSSPTYNDPTIYVCNVKGTKHNFRSSVALTKIAKGSKRLKSGQDLLSSQFNDEMSQHQHIIPVPIPIVYEDEQEMLNGNGELMPHP